MAIKSSTKRWHLGFSAVVGLGLLGCTPVTLADLDPAPRPVQVIAAAAPAASSQLVLAGRVVGQPRPGQQASAAGTVESLHVMAGQLVGPGDRLLSWRTQAGKRRVLRASHAGYVDQVHLRVGDALDPDKTAVSLSHPRRYDLRISLPAPLAIDLKVGQRIPVSLPLARTRVVQARIDELNDREIRASFSYAHRGVNQLSVPVSLPIDDELLAVVPARAIVKPSSAPGYLTVANGGQAERRKVVVLDLYRGPSPFAPGETPVIVRGVPVGASIVLSGLRDLLDRDPITVVTAEVSHD